jgi:hypothetical protein
MQGVDEVILEVTIERILVCPGLLKDEDDDSGTQFKWSLGF